MTGSVDVIAEEKSRGKLYRALVKLVYFNGYVRKLHDEGMTGSKSVRMSKRERSNASREEAVAVRRSQGPFV